MHLGSLYTALASYLDARSRQGKWLLRIDDVDQLRCKTEYSVKIIETLAAFGLRWDETVYYQTEQISHYQKYLNKLITENQAYPCYCSRKQLSNSPVYPGYCLNYPTKQTKPFALRVKASKQTIAFKDVLNGTIRCNPDKEIGDFIIRRKDRLFAYQFAVVIDEAIQKINHVVRGNDLLESTPRQIMLQQQLGFQTVNYCHIPVLVDQNGCKLSKQTFAKAIEPTHIEKTLFQLLKLLNQNPPTYLKHATRENILDWAILNWNLAALKKIRAIPLQI